MERTKAMPTDTMETKKPALINPGKENPALERENASRHAVCISASTIFALLATLLLIAGFFIYALTYVHGRTEMLNRHGVQTIFYDGAVWEQSGFRGGYYFEDEDTLRNFLRYDWGITDEKELAKYTLKNQSFNVKFQEDSYKRVMGILWLALIFLSVAAPVALVLAVRRSGRKKAGGGIVLPWYDRIFVEFQILAGVLASCAIMVPAFLIMSWMSDAGIIERFFTYFGNLSAQDVALIRSSNNLYLIDPFASASLGDVFQPAWIQLVLAVLIALLAFLFDTYVITSIARKLKNRSFLRSTILGAALYTLGDNMADSPRVSVKVLGTMLGSIAFMLVGALFALAAFEYAAWFPILLGGLVMMALVLVIVPKQLRKYKMVCAGIDELQKGNFEYKIPDLGRGELASLARSVNQISAAQSIAIRNELKSQRLRTDLISNVSHDLRTPLTSMVSYVDLLKKEGLQSENAAEYVRILSEKTERLQKLTDNLFEAAKASSGDIPVHMERIEMNSMTAQALGELEENLAKNEIQVILDGPSEPAYVYADGKLLWRVIENLLTNVSKYAHPASRAYVDIRDTGEYISLEVKNMSRDQLNISADELMERFKRGDGSRNTEGSGLGLAIARDLTLLMQGRFDIKIDGDLFKAIVELKKA